MLSASSKKMILDGFEGKILFLKIFGWDCQYCKKEIPELIHLKDELKDSLEIIAIGGTATIPKEESREYRKSMG